MLKNLPANAGDTGDAGSIPGGRRSPEREPVTRSSFLAWRISWTEEPAGLQSVQSQSWPQLSGLSTNASIKTTAKLF